MRNRLNAAADQERKEDNNDEFYLEGFHCPILQEPFKNPVMAQDGHTYELTAFQRWVAQKRTSPLTGYPLASTATQDNYAMKKALAEYKEVILPKLKVLKELEPQLEAFKKVEREKIEKEKEIEQLKRVEKAFYEQRMALDNVIRSEHEKHRRVQAVEAAFFQQGQELEHTKKQLIAKDLELTRLKQARQAELVNARASCSVASLFFSAVSGVAGNDNLEQGDANSNLIRAIQSGHARGVLQALNAQADVNQRVGLDKATPLILAVRLFVTSPRQAKRIIILLCSRGARVDMGDCKGDRPLHWAAYHNLSWPVFYLLERKANPLLKNRALETPSQKLLKERNFLSTIMNRLLRAESRFAKYQEEVQFSRFYNPARYSEPGVKVERAVPEQHHYRPA